MLFQDMMNTMSLNFLILTGTLLHGTVAIQH